jgi:acetyl/propionyl-CoA carboxylase alpha subunit
MDRAEWIGPTPPAESYLSTTAILEAARRSGAEAVHPGYGFLSESATFARAVEEAGLVFVGPPAETMASLGNKLNARRTAEAAGVAVTPGLLIPADAATHSDMDEVGYPLLVKAAAGGGGRGVRRVDARGELTEALAAARAEALAAFGDGTVYVERLVTDARHVEVQLLGDRAGGLAVLGERDCSVQRRHQKLVEESPAPNLSAEVRSGLADDARRIGSAVAFHNAATVEFLVDGADNRWFLEMNTRLQVEHGVTELVTGIDLVAWQLRIAAGERLPVEVIDSAPRGHAIQARVYAEDPWNGFAPAAGRIRAWRMPAGPGVRIDAGVEAGTDLPTAYDPLLAKVMVHANARNAAVDRLRRALDETVVSGVPTTLGFHRWLVDHPGFAQGRYDTTIVSSAWGEGPALAEEARELAAVAVAAARPEGGLGTPRRPAATGPAAGRSSLDAGGGTDGRRSWIRVAREDAVDRG